MSGLLIIGAGGHGKVVADTAFEDGRWDKIAFLDDRYEQIDRVMNCPVLGSLLQAQEYLQDYPDMVVALGNNTLRVELLKRYMELGFKLPVLVHPTAFISRAARLNPGTVAFPRVAVNAEAKIGFGSIINTGAIIDHDCLLGEGVHICPGVNLAGEVKVGDYSWIGIGTSVIQQVSIGENVVIGAGSVIVKDIESNVKVLGVPGRVVTTMSETNKRIYL